MENVRRFERMLSDEGYVLLKLWFHLSRAQQRKRLRALEADDETKWRVTDSDWDHYENHAGIADAAARAMRFTSHENAPWIVVPGMQARYRSLLTGRALLDAMVNEPTSSAPEPAVHPLPALDGRSVLHTLDLGQTLDKKAYDHELEEWQGELARLIRHKRFRKHSAVVVFEGMDAAGKGGAIRRVVEGVDPRNYRIVPIAAPTDEEKAHPYLWRFWRHIPRRGKLLVFDRSWYGRVLVERVEGYCSTADWLRAYGEINDFEEQLDRHGTIVIKLWLHIDADVQLARFRDRESEPVKQWKIGPDDWRNRGKWPAYEQAIGDMVDRTSTEIAPWTLVEANDKNFARVKVLRTICERIRDAIE
jgi:polyphosphate:AMP phosphotransferase